MLQKVKNNLTKAKTRALVVCKRYIKYILIGAMSLHILIKIDHHIEAGLQHFCQEECLIQSMENEISVTNPMIIKHIEDLWLDPPSPVGKFRGNFDLKIPPWAKIYQWEEAHEFILKYFSNFKGQGTFIEVGAYDGEFMSLTLLLEQEKGYKGLLIEPNPEDYKKLTAKNRSSYSINACASPIRSNTKTKLWIRQTPDNLFGMKLRVEKGNNRLISYVHVADMELGQIIPVQCFNIVSMALATFGRMSIDLLTLSTFGGEMDILDTIPVEFKIRVLSITTMLPTQRDVQDLITKTGTRGLSLAYSQDGTHIFIPTSETTAMLKTSPRNR